jgi:hypothetical protein
MIQVSARLNKNRVHSRVDKKMQVLTNKTRFSTPKHKKNNPPLTEDQI